MKMYIRIKNIPNKYGKMYPYAYLCESHWIDGKPHQRVLKYLGRVNMKPINLKTIKFEQCMKCGSKDDLVIDHIIPLTKGGTNDILNIQILCKKCNEEKADN